MMFPEAIGIGTLAYLESAEDSGPTTSAMNETRMLRLRRILTSNFGLMLGQTNTCQREAAKASPGFFFSRMSRSYKVFQSLSLIHI